MSVVLVRLFQPSLTLQPPSVAATIRRLLVASHPSVHATPTYIPISLKRKIGRGSPNIFVPITAAMRPNYWNAAADIVKPRRRKSASATGELLSQTDPEYLRDLFTRLGLANPQCE